MPVQISETPDPVSRIRKKIESMKYKGSAPHMHVSFNGFLDEILEFITTLGTQPQRPFSSNLLAPFLKVAQGIPDNWPGECILRFDQRHDGSVFLSYHGINDASNGITTPMGDSSPPACSVVLDFTDREKLALDELCKSKDMTPKGVLCAALRLYQAVSLGAVEVLWKSTGPIGCMGDDCPPND